MFMRVTMGSSGSSGSGSSGSGSGSGGSGSGGSSEGYCLAGLPPLLLSFVSV